MVLAPIRRLPLVLVLATILTAALAACGGDDDKPATAATTTSNGGTGAAARTAQPSVDDLIAKFRAFDVPAALVSGATAGSADAKVTLEMYEDFQCPHCLIFTLMHEQRLFEEYVIPGKVKVRFRQAPILGAESGTAALAATCAAKQDKFWPYAKALFLTQADAGQLTKEQTNVGRFAEQPLTDLASKTGLDAPAFTACLKDESTIAAANEDIRAGTTLGVRGTPSFSVNGRLVTTPADAAAWRQLLDTALATAK